jgi:hypothetical protein
MNLRKAARETRAQFGQQNIKSRQLAESLALDRPRVRGPEIEFWKMNDGSRSASQHPKMDTWFQRNRHTLITRCASLSDTRSACPWDASQGTSDLCRSAFRVRLGYDEIRDLILRRYGKPVPPSDRLLSKDRSQRSKHVPSRRASLGSSEEGGLRCPDPGGDFLAQALPAQRRRA